VHRIAFQVLSLAQNAEHAPMDSSSPPFARKKRTPNAKVSKSPTWIERMSLRLWRCCSKPCLKHVWYGYTGDHRMHAGQAVELNTAALLLYNADCSPIAHAKSVTCTKAGDSKAIECVEGDPLDGNTCPVPCVYLLYYTVLVQ
jgi:hypothetical protein